MNKLIQYLVRKILNEGGNVFDETESIPKDNIKPTLIKFADEMNKYFPGILKNSKTLGSAGKKELSGDIDLAIDTKHIINPDGTPKLKELNIEPKQYQAVFEKYKSRARTAQESQLIVRSILFFIAKKINESSSIIKIDGKGSVSGALFCMFPQFDSEGKITDKYVQIDLNFGNVDWLSFSYYSDVYKDNVKGLHRTQLMLSLFSNKGYTFSHNYGVKEKETNKVVANNPEEAIQVLNSAYGFNIDSQTLSNYFKLQEFLKKNLDEKTYNQIIDIYLKILDSTRADIPIDLQEYWIKNQDRLGLTGKFLPDDSRLIKYRKMLTESGSIGANRIPRSAVEETFKMYVEKVLKKFSGFKDAKISGSYNTTMKPDHGDIDLIINIQGDETDKKVLKKTFAKFIDSLPDNVTVPFKAGRHTGKKSAGTGDIVIVQFPIVGHEGLNVQIDNMIVTSEIESDYRKSFLDLPAEKQGLLIGLTKAILLEENEQSVFSRMGIQNIPQKGKNQEYEFNLSTKGLSLRLVTLGDGYRELDRKEVWNTYDWNYIKKLFINYNINGSFDDLLSDLRLKLKNPRSRNRIKGVFKSVVVINAGEAGTPKGNNKLEAINTVNSL